MSPRPVQLEPAAKGVHWSELDLLRTLAITLMVLNHVAVAGGTVSTSGPIAAIAFAGSFAPVIFFFLTGLGYGVQSARRPAKGYGYLHKVLILLAADVMLWARPQTRLGLDFFGFIGLSMLLLELVRRVPRSGLLAIALAAVVVAMRFIVGPLLKVWLATQAPAWAMGVVGVTSVAGVSYPLAPWLTYPLIGYSFGRLAATWGSPAAVHRPAVLISLAGLTVLGTLATTALMAKGAVLFRWSTMSFAYFIAGWAVLGAALLLVLGVSRLQLPEPFVKTIGLSGVRSFAVVPLHYAILILCTKILGPVVGLGTFSRNALLVLISSIVGSALIPRAAATLKTTLERSLVWIVVVVTFPCAYLVLIEGRFGPGPNQVIRMSIQLAFCVLLATSRLTLRPSRAPDPKYRLQIVGTGIPES